MQNKISLEEFMIELRTAIEDVFIAKITQTDNKIMVQFLSGQEFVLSVEER